MTTFQPTGFVCGEVEFWRHPRVFWDQILDSVQDLGIENVATFFCWDFHEVEPGKFDLAGDTAPERNVDEFMRLCHQRGLKVFARPGPIIDSEWPSRGPTMDVAALERTHPEFVAKARAWTRAIAAKLAEHQEPHGPVTLVQLDNEAYYPHVTEASATEADSDMHIPFDPDLVLADLTNWLDDPSDLPAELLPHVGDFPRDPAPAFAQLSRPHRQIAFEFINVKVREYLEWLTQEMRDHGVTVPITTNIKQSLAYVDAARIGRVVDWVGHNYYLEHLGDRDELRVGHWWAGLARAESSLPWAPEFWCGRWVEEGADTAVFREEHYRYVLLTALAMGFRALNFFTLVDRDDWHYAALTGLGKKRAAARVIQSIRDLLSRVEGDERLTDVGFVWSRAQHQDFLAGQFQDWRELSAFWTAQSEPREPGAWWDAFGSLVDDDHDVELIAPTSDTARYRYVVYAGAEWVESSVIDALLERLEAGRPVVVVGESLPSLTLAGTPHHAAARVRQLADRVTFAAGPGDLPAALAGLGAGSWVRADQPLLTTAYRRADGSVWVFIVNPAERQVRSPLHLRDELRSMRCEVVIGGAGPDSSNAIELPARSVTVLELTDHA